MKYKNYATLAQVEERYLRDHPEQIDEYLAGLFEAFSQDGDLKASLASLRVIVKVKGMSETADQIGMTRQGLQKALSPKGNPTVSTFNKVLNSFGYRLSVEKLAGE